MLQRSSQVGEFYRMAPPAVFDETRKLPDTYMDILIYDEERDMHEHITFERALYACGLADTASLENEILKKCILGQDNKIEEKLLDRHKRHAVVCGLPAEDRLEGDGKNISKENLAKIVAAGCWIPCEIVIARPFIEHLMMSAIVAVAGRDTGATLFGPADMSAAHAPAPASVRSLAELAQSAGRSRPTPPSRPSRGERTRLCAPLALHPTG